MPTYYAQVSYTGNGSTTTYAITFNFLDSTHVKAFIDGVETTAFTISSSNLTFTTAPANNASIRIERQTPIDARLVDFTDGSVLTESDLDKSADQNFYVAQEITDDSLSTMKIGTDDKFDGQSKVIKDLANPVNDQDAVTKYYLENTWLSTSDKANITTLGGISDLGTLASNSANVTTVANNIASVNAVATDISKVITVADDLNEAVAEIDTVATNITNVNNVGNNITNVNVVGNNISDVNAFGNTYKISATAPSSPTEGMLWWDSTNDVMKVYSGSSFQNAGSSVNGTSQRNTFTATASQTVFSGNDDYGVGLVFDNNYLDVFLNGVKLVEGSSNDYTVSGGNQITLTSGASAGDILQTISYGTFDIASFSATAVTSDTLPVARGGTGLTSSNLTGNATKALVVNSAENAFELANASSAEIYGFVLTDTDSDGVVDTLQVTTTNGGNDNISASTYASFDDVVYASTGFTWSLNSSGHLIATI